MSQHSNKPRIPGPYGRYTELVRYINCAVVTGDLTATQAGMIFDTNIDVYRQVLGASRTTAMCCAMALTDHELIDAAKKLEKKFLELCPPDLFPFLCQEFREFKRSLDTGGLRR